MPNQANASRAPRETPSLRRVNMRRSAQGLAAGSENDLAPGGYFVARAQPPLQTRYDAPLRARRAQHRYPGKGSAPIGIGKIAQHGGFILAGRSAAVKFFRASPTGRRMRG